MTTEHTTLRQMLMAHLRAGAGHWITDEAASHWIAAIEGEWERVVAWRNRINPRTGCQYSWFGAARAVAENPPTLDRMGDEVWVEETCR